MRGLRARNVVRQKRHRRRGVGAYGRGDAEKAVKTLEGVYTVVAPEGRIGQRPSGLSPLSPGMEDRRPQGRLHTPPTAWRKPKPSGRVGPTAV